MSHHRYNYDSGLVKRAYKRLYAFSGILTLLDTYARHLGLCRNAIEVFKMVWLGERRA